MIQENRMRSSFQHFQRYNAVHNSLSHDEGEQSTNSPLTGKSSSQSSLSSISNGPQYAMDHHIEEYRNVEKSSDSPIVMNRRITTSTTLNPSADQQVVLVAGRGRIVETRTTSTKQVFSPVVSYQKVKTGEEISGYKRQSNDRHQAISTGESPHRHAKTIIRESSSTMASNSSALNQATKNQYSGSNQIINNGFNKQNNQKTDGIHRIQEKLDKESMTKENSTDSCRVQGQEPRFS